MLGAAIERPGRLAVIVRTQGVPRALARLGRNGRMSMLALWAFAPWTDMFRLAIPVVEKVLRPIIVYAFLVLGLRIFGKRELAQLNPFDLVVLLSLSNTVQNAIIGEDTSITGGLIGAFTLLAFNYLVIRFLFGHRRLDQVLEGLPTLLIEDGRPIFKALARELITESELLSVLHRQGFSRFDEVKRCLLEPGGTFAVEAKEPTADVRHHSEILARIDQLGRQIEDLKRQVAHANAASTTRSPGDQG